MNIKKSIWYIVSYYDIIQYTKSTSSLDDNFPIFKSFINLYASSECPILSKHSVASVPAAFSRTSSPPGC